MRCEARKEGGACFTVRLPANHFALAKQLGAAIAEDEDRQVFESELARIPQRVTPR